MRTRLAESATGVPPRRRELSFGGMDAVIPPGMFEEIACVTRARRAARARPLRLSISDRIRDAEPIG